MKRLMLLLAAALVASPAFADKKLEDAIAKAEAQMDKGKPEEALKILQKAADNPPSSEGYVALARLQLRAASAEEAAQSAAKAVELSTSAPPAARAEALAMLANLDLVRGSGRDALAHAQDAVKAEGTNVSALAALARAQAHNGDGTAALATADRAVQAAGTSGIAHVARGEALLALSRSKDAEAELRKALEVEPKLTLARTRLAAALLAEGKAAEAEQEAKTASEADPKSAEAFALYGKAILEKDGNLWNDAIAQAQQGAFLNARNAMVQTTVGQIFDAAGNVDQAQAAYGRALAADPGYVPARLAMVQTQIRKGQIDAALTDALKIAQEMNSGAAYLQVGRLYLRKGDFAAAAIALEKAVALSPGIAEAHARLGTAYQYIHKSPEALAEYKKAVELDPSNTDFRTTYGLILGIANQDEAGAAELRKVIETPGYKSADAYINLGWIYRNMEPKKADESVTAYKKALEIDSKSEQAALGLGWSYTYLKNWDEAIKAFQLAMEIDPTTASEAENGIAWSYFFKKDMPQAKAHLEKAKTAGRGDTRLATNIERVEKGLAAEGGPDMPKAPPPAPKIERPDAGTLCETLAKGGPGVKMRTANQLVSYGAEGVPCLIGALNDASWDVRTSAANALGAIGPRAAVGLPHLTNILNSPRVTEKTVMTKDEMQLMLKEEDFRKAVRNAVLKIQGK